MRLRIAGKYLIGLLRTVLPPWYRVPAEAEYQGLALKLFAANAANAANACSPTQLTSNYVVGVAL